jgi:hypothetical protein
MELRANANRWLPIAFAFFVSEVVPMSSLVELRESLLQISNWKLGLGLPEHYVRGVMALTVGYFPALVPLILLAAFYAYLAVTGTLTLKGLLCGLPTGFFVFSLGFMGVTALFVFSTLHVPQPIFYYLILRLPLFFALVLALRIAHHFESSVRSSSTQQVAG